MDDKLKAKLDKFFSAYPRHSSGKRQILIFAGEDPLGIIYLTEGLVRQYAVSADGSEVVLNIFKPPSFFPMNWAINHTKNRYFYESIDAVNFHRAPAGDVVEFLKQNPDVTYNLLSRLYSGLDGILERTVYLMAGSALNRLAVEIIIDCKRFGEKEPGGSYTLKISQQELANRTGLSRETVSRDIKYLPFVKITHGTVQVSDLHGLEKYLVEQS